MTSMSLGKHYMYISSNQVMGMLWGHRMSGVGRDLCRSPSPIPCPSRVTQSRLHRTMSRRGLNISRECCCGMNGLEGSEGSKWWDEGLGTRLG